MFETLLSKIAAIILAPIMAITGFFAPPPEAPAVGTSLPEAVAVFETSLAAPITAAATTMTLTANSIRGGGSLSGFNCFTIDEGSAQAEFICGTVATTTVTGLLRGISPADGITEDTDLQFSHRRGANVKITDFPIIQRLKLQNNGEGSFENAISYASGVTPTGNNHLTDVEYVLGVVNGGAVSFDQEIITGNAGATVATGTVVYRSLSDGEWYAADVDVPGTFTDRLIGITQGAGTDGNAIANGVLISGLDSNQTGLSANALYFLSSTAGGVQTATSSQMIGVAKSTTELILAPHILDTYNGYSTTYAGNNTHTGTNSFSATSTFTGPAVFSGSLSGHASTTFTVYTASTTWSKPSGLEYIIVEVIGGGGGGGSEGTNNGAGGGGGAGGYSKEILTAADLAATSTVTITVGGGGAGGSAGDNNGVTGVTTSFSSFLQATGGVGGTTSNSGGKGGGGGTGSGGDVNITSESGESGYEDAGADSGVWAVRSGGATIYGASCGGGGAGAISSGAGTAGNTGCVIIQEVF